MNSNYTYVVLTCTYLMTPLFYNVIHLRPSLDYCCQDLDPSLCIRKIKGTAGVLEQDFATMKEQSRDQQHGKKLSTQSHLMSSNLLQLMQSYALPQITSIRPRLMQSCSVRRQDAPQQGLTIILVLEWHIQDL